MLFTLAVPGLVFSVLQCPSICQRGEPCAVFSLFGQGISFCTNPVSLAHTIAFLTFFLFPVFNTWPHRSTSGAQSLPAVPFTCYSDQPPPLPLFQLAHPGPEHYAWLLCLSKYIKICVQSGSQGLGALVKLHLREDLCLLAVTCPCQHLTFISELWVSAFPCKLYSRNI